MHLQNIQNDTGWVIKNYLHDKNNKRCATHIDGLLNRPITYKSVSLRGHGATGTGIVWKSESSVKRCNMNTQRQKNKVHKKWQKEVQNWPWLTIMNCNVIFVSKTNCSIHVHQPLHPGIRVLSPVALPEVSSTFFFTFKELGSFSLSQNWLD